MHTPHKLTSPAQTCAHTGPFDFSSMMPQRQFKFNTSSTKLIISSINLFLFRCSLGYRFLGCCNKRPQTWWLKTTGIYSLAASENRSLKSSLPLEARSGGESFLASSCCTWPQVFLACHCIPSIVTWLSALLLTCLKSPSAFLLEGLGKIQEDLISKS